MALSAESLLNNFWDGVLPVNVVLIAKMLGISIHYGLFDNQESNPLEYGAVGAVRFIDGVPVILIDNMQSPEKTRFVIAHEIAHCVLHHDIVRQKGLVDRDKTINVAGVQIDTRESEANKFALSLLMPKSSIDALLSAGVTKVEQMALYFYLPVDIVLYRLKNLGYVT